MKDTRQPATEPIIYQMWMYDRREPPHPDPEPGTPGQEKDIQTDEFWAGRSLAMRQSARVAA
jgi:hypothetical protein